jgi:FkbM family methyltransferase
MLERESFRLFVMNIGSTVRRYVRKYFRNLGYQRRIAPDFVDVMNAHKIDVVLDCGANDGGFGREIRDRGYRGLIVSFEPNPKAFARLQKSIRKDDCWIAYPIALGDQNGEVDFHINSIEVMSSIKELNDFGRSTAANVVKINRIKVSRLDTFMDAHPQLLRNVYLKIDTQGYEMEVLRGAGEKLSEISIVQAEIALIHTYRHESHWSDIVNWLRIKEFELVTAVCNSIVGTRVREFDFVFANLGSRVRNSVTCNHSVDT